MGILVTPKPKRERKKNWIAGATENEGGLHRSLGIPEDETIPESKIKAAEKRGGKVGKQASLAETLKKMRRKR